MATLASLLLTETNRPLLVDACCSLIDSEVRGKKGLKGQMIKMAYKTVTTVKRRFVPEVVDALLDDWVSELEPHYEAHVALDDGKAFQAYVAANADGVSESLLKVTDRRAQVTSHKRVKGLYLKLRPSAKANVVEAVPRLAEIVDRFLIAKS